MRKAMKSLSLISAAGVVGLCVAGSAQAATRTWDSSKTSGKWSATDNWGSTGVPVSGDTVQFPKGITATYNLNLTGLGALNILSSGSGTANLKDVPSASGWLGAVTFNTCAVRFYWKDDVAPTNPMTSLSVKGNTTLDFRGATQTLSGMPVTSGKTFKLKNGTLATGWTTKNPLTVTVDEGATWNVNERLRFTGSDDGQQNVVVQNGGVMNLTSSDSAYAGLWYKARKMNITCSNGGVFNSKKANFNVGWGGTGTIKGDNATLDFGTKTVCCTRPTDKTDASSFKTTYNGVATLALTNGAILKAGVIEFGYNQSSSSDYGSFTLDASSGSKLYIGSLVANGATVNTITFDDATIIPCAANKEFLIQGHEKLSKQYIKVTEGGLTIDNIYTNNVTIAERLANVGAVTAKMYGADFTLKTKMTVSGGVTFENPGLITLACDQQAFLANSTVTFKFTEEPVAAEEAGRPLVDWSANGKPANVTFEISADSVKGYELKETDTGLNVQKKGFEPAAFCDWTGGDGAEATNATDMANWTFKNAAGEELPKGYMGAGTVFRYKGNTPQFDATDAMFAGRTLLIASSVTLPADRNWSGFETVALAEDVTLNENAHKLKLAGNLAGANDNATVRNGGDLDFTIPTGELRLLGPLVLDGVTNIVKRGPGTLTATNLTTATLPALTLTGGTMAFDWSGREVGTNFLAGITTLSERSATLDLGGGRQTVSGVPLEAEATLTLKNGTLTTGWVGKDKDAQDSDRTIKVVGANAEWIVDGALRAEQCKNEAYVSGGGVLTVTGASVLGDWYHSRSFKIYVDGGTLNHKEADLTVGATGVGLIKLENRSVLNAEGRTIKASVKTKKSGKHTYNGDATLTLTGGSTLKAKAISYGDDDGTVDKDNTEFTLTASGNSTLYIESLTAAGRTKDAITFNGATVVPMASCTLFKGATNLTANAITVGSGGLRIANENTNTVTIAETLKGSGPVTFDLNGADLTITEPLQCTNVKFVNPGRVYLKGENTTFAADATVTIDYTDASYVRRSKIITWDTPQPETLTVVQTVRSEAITGRKIKFYPDGGITLETGFMLYFD